MTDTTRITVDVLDVPAPVSGVQTAKMSPRPNHPLAPRMRKKLVSDEIQYPNELTRGTKPHLAVKYIKLWSALGPLDYKDFNTEDLMGLWECQDDQARKALTELAKTNWAVVEKLPKRMNRVWLMHTTEDTEKHLKRMKSRVETHREMNMGRVKDYAEKYAKQSYRAEKLSDRKTKGYKYVPKSILNQGLTDTEVYVFLGLWSFGQKSSAETEQTAKSLGVSRSTYMRALAVLKDHGALNTTKHPKYGTNVYDMKTDWMTQQNRLDDTADPGKPTRRHTIENEFSRENDLDTEPAVPEAPKDSPEENQGRALVDTLDESSSSPSGSPLVDEVDANASPSSPGSPIEDVNESDDVSDFRTAYLKKIEERNKAIVEKNRVRESQVRYSRPASPLEMERREILNELRRATLQ